MALFNSKDKIEVPDTTYQDYISGEISKSQEAIYQDKIVPTEDYYVGEPIYNSDGSPSPTGFRPGIMSNEYDYAQRTSADLAQNANLGTAYNPTSGAAVSERASNTINYGQVRGRGNTGAQLSGYEQALGREVAAVKQGIGGMATNFASSSASGASKASQVASSAQEVLNNSAVASMQGRAQLYSDVAAGAFSWESAVRTKKENEVKLAPPSYKSNSGNIAYDPLGRIRG